MRVGYLPSDMDGPGFYRCLSPGRELAQHGVDVFMPKFKVKMVGDRFRVQFDIDMDLPRSADLYVLQQRKERDWQEYGVAKMRGLGMATIADVDDNYVNLPPYNPAFYGTHEYRRDDGVILNRALRRNMKLKPRGGVATITGRPLPTYVSPQINKNNKVHLHEQFRMVDMLTVSTPFLADVYAPYNANIRVVRNFVDWDVWDTVTPQYEVERERLRIGWLGVYRYRYEDLKVLQRVLPRFMRNHPDVDFVTNGAATHQFFGIPEAQRVTVGEYDFQTVLPAYCDMEGVEHDPVFTGELPVGQMTAVCDIGLVPLAMNDLNQSKSHLKGMEYNAAGIPFIASPTESYKDYWIKEGKGGNGFIAHTEDDWYQAMELLVENHDLRRESGKAGRETARRHSIQQNWREWHDVFTDLLGSSQHATARKAIQMGAVQKFTELGPLLEIVNLKQPKVLVEIGSARGGCFWAFSREAPDDALLISMDIPAGSPIDVRDGKDVYHGRDRGRFSRLVKPTQGVRLIDIDSHTQGALVALQNALGYRQIDFLFIDGDHRYEGVKQDYQMYSPLVRPGGVIAFHDITQHWDERVGVTRFWNEIKEGKKVEEFYGPETWGFQPWGGIGVIHV